MTRGPCRRRCRQACDGDKGAGHRRARQAPVANAPQRTIIERGRADAARRRAWWCGTICSRYAGGVDDASRVVRRRDDCIRDRCVGRRSCGHPGTSRADAGLVMDRILRRRSSRQRLGKRHVAQRDRAPGGSRFQPRFSVPAPAAGRSAAASSARTISSTRSILALAAIITAAREHIGFHHGSGAH
jgi:hypothetical protein